jgi:hypothetical protein
MSEQDHSGLVPVFNQPAGSVEEMEAFAIKGLLEANGIEAIMVNPGTLPNLSAQVLVAEELAAEAQRIIAEARAAGPAAAEEAERASERGETT